MNETTKQNIMNAIEWECLGNRRIKANLENANKQHPSWGEFGSMACFDVVDIAKEMINEIQYVTVQAIPDLIILVQKDVYAHFKEHQNFQIPK